jgi:hypothetical protein
MNAPTTITDPIAAYASTVHVHLPDSHGADLDARCRLMLARDTAAKALNRCSDAEAGLMHEIERLGTKYALAGVSTEALGDLLNAERMMLKAAGYLGRFVDRVGR